MKQGEPRGLGLSSPPRRGNLIELIRVHRLGSLGAKRSRFFALTPSPSSHAVGEGCRGARRFALLRVLPVGEGRRGARWCALLRVPPGDEGCRGEQRFALLRVPPRPPFGRGGHRGEGKPNSMQGGQPLSPPCFLWGKGADTQVCPYRITSDADAARAGSPARCPTPAYSQAQAQPRRCRGGRCKFLHRRRPEPRR